MPTAPIIRVEPRPRSDLAKGVFELKLSSGKRTFFVGIFHADVGLLAAQDDGKSGRIHSCTPTRSQVCDQCGLAAGHPVHQIDLLTKRHGH